MKFMLSYFLIFALSGISYAQNELQIKLTPNKRMYVGDEDVWVTISISNSTSREIALDIPNFALVNDSMTLKIVSPTGKLLNYIGPISYGPRNNVLVLPYKSWTRHVNLRHHFEFNEVGKYTMTALFKKHASQLQTIIINKELSKRLIFSKDVEASILSIYSVSTKHFDFTKAKIILSSNGMVAMSYLLPIKENHQFLDMGLSDSYLGILAENTDRKLIAYNIGIENGKLEKTNESLLSGANKVLFENHNGKFHVSSDKAPANKSKETNYVNHTKSKSITLQPREGSKVCLIINALSQKRFYAPSHTDNTTQSKSQTEKQKQTPHNIMVDRLHERTVTFSLFGNQALSLEDIVRLLAINGRCMVHIISDEETKHIDGEDWRVRSNPDITIVEQENYDENMYILRFTNATVYDAFATLADAAAMSFKISENGIVVLRK